MGYGSPLLSSNDVSTGESVFSVLESPGAPRLLLDAAGNVTFRRLRQSGELQRLRP